MSRNYHTGWTYSFAIFLLFVLFFSIYIYVFHIYSAFVSRALGPKKFSNRGNKNIFHYTQTQTCIWRKQTQMLFFDNKTRKHFDVAKMLICFFLWPIFIAVFYRHIYLFVYYKKKSISAKLQDLVYIIYTYMFYIRALKNRFIRIFFEPLCRKHDRSVLFKCVYRKIWFRAIKFFLLRHPFTERTSSNIKNENYSISLIAAVYDGHYERVTNYRP